MAKTFPMFDIVEAFSRIESSFATRSERRTSASIHPMFICAERCRLHRDHAAGKLSESPRPSPDDHRAGATAPS